MPVRDLFKTATFGGIVFWTDVVNADGWRIQYNELLDTASPLKPYRLLDPDDYLIASADEVSELENDLNRLAKKYSERNPLLDYNTVVNTFNALANALISSELSH